MKKETLEKIAKSKSDNCRKIGELCGYEIFVDSRNYIAVKERKNLYYSTLGSLYSSLNEKLIKEKVSSIDLTTVVNEIKKLENEFMSKLKETLGKKYEMDQGDYLKLED
jgi:hypothetical protein